jgi:nicotinamidase-related amidase
VDASAGTGGSIHQESRRGLNENPSSAGSIASIFNRSASGKREFCDVSIWRIFSADTGRVPGRSALRFQVWQGSPHEPVSLHDQVTGGRKMSAERSCCAGHIGSAGLAGLAALILAIAVSPAHAGQTIIEEWSRVQAPPPVELKQVTVNPRETAFLILDIEERTCNQERRPRCVESVPRIADFLQKARTKGMPVVYSLTGRGTRETILPGAAPIGDEPIVKSSVDKFFNTDLDDILKERGIKTVIIIGTTAEGAVLHTATGAAVRGYNVIVPVDGVSAGTLYAEQYTAWHLLNAPGTRNRTTLTRFDMIEF